MIELVFLALLNRLKDWGLAPLIATRTVAADAGALHHFLSEPANQLRLLRRIPRGVDVHVKSRASGRVLRVEVLRKGRTALWATWILTAGRGTTEVDLAVQFESRSVATRLALVLGGRRWLTHRVDDALARLGLACARAAEELAPAPVAAGAVRSSQRTRSTRSASGADRSASYAVTEPVAPSPMEHLHG